MWWQIGIQIAILALSYIFKPKTTSTSNQTIDDVGAATATEGDRIVDILGTGWVSTPHVAWYGDFDDEDIYSSSSKK